MLYEMLVNYLYWKIKKISVKIEVVFSILNIRIEKGGYFYILCIVFFYLWNSWLYFENINVYLYKKFK